MGIMRFCDDTSFIIDTTDWQSSMFVLTSWMVMVKDRKFLKIEGERERPLWINRWSDTNDGQWMSSSQKSFSASFQTRFSRSRVWSAGNCKITKEIGLIPPRIYIFALYTFMTLRNVRLGRFVKAKGASIPLPFLPWICRVREKRCGM